MSSQQLDEQRQRMFDKAISNAIGLSLEEYEAIGADPQLHASDEGVPYGYNIYWGEDADPSILAKINGYTKGATFVRTGLIHIAEL